MNYNDKLTDPADKFLKQYEATGQLSRNKMYAKRPEYHYGRMRDYDYYSTTASFQIEREPYVEINIPQHRFKQLVERHEWYQKLESEADYYKGVVEQYREDERVRDRCPAVQKAWRNYITLLELAR
jgi:hypothetical protein